MDEHVEMKLKENQVMVDCVLNFRGPSIARPFWGDQSAVQETYFTPMKINCTLRVIGRFTRWKLAITELLVE